MRLRSLGMVLIVFFVFGVVGISGVMAGDSQSYWVESLSDGGWVRLTSSTQLGDGSVVAVGWIAEERYNGDLLVVKFSKYGTVEWAKRYGGPKDDYATGVAIGPNGDIIVVGATQSYGAGSYDIWVLRLYPDGRVRWQRTYGGSGDDRAMGVAIDANGKIIVVGGTTSFGSSPGKSSDLWALKLSGTGDVVWSRTYGRTNWDWGTSVTTDGDGNIYVGGIYWESVSAPYSPFGKGGDAWILKLGPSGNVIWNRIFGDVGNEWVADIGLLGGDVVFVGSTNSFGAGDYDLFLGRMNSSGELEWMWTYGGPKKDVGTSITVFNPSCAFAVGYTYSDPELSGPKALVVSFSPEKGRADWLRVYGGPGGERAYGVWAFPKAFTVVGKTTSFGNGQENGWILRLQISGVLFKDGVRDSNLVSKVFKPWKYEIKPRTVSPNLIVKAPNPSVTPSDAAPRTVEFKVTLQYYHGAPPETSTTTSSASPSTTSTTSTLTSSTSTAVSSTTTTVSETHTSSTLTPIKTSSSTTSRRSSTTETVAESNKGGICGPGLVLLLALGVFFMRRR